VDRGGGPSGGEVAFCAGEGGDGVDVDGGGEEEDACDCFGGGRRGHCCGLAVRCGFGSV